MTFLPTDAIKHTRDSCAFNLIQWLEWAINMGEVLCTHSECRCQNKATRRSVGGATTVRPPRAAVNKAAVFIARGFYRWHPWHWPADASDLLKVDSLFV